MTSGCLLKSVSIDLWKISACYFFVAAMPKKTTLAQLSAGAQVAFQNKDLRLGEGWRKTRSITKKPILINAKPQITA
jgi:hypothetical protein